MNYFKFRFQASAVRWVGFASILSLIASFTSTLSGCQLVDQAIEIKDIFTPTEPLPDHQRPLWNSVSTPSGPKLAGHSGAVVALRSIGAPTVGLYSIGLDKKLLYWDLATGRAAEVRKLGSSLPPTVATFGLRHALVAYSSGSDVVIECVSGCPRSWSLKRLRARAKTLDFHNDDKALLIGSVDGKVTRWKFVEETEAETLEERDKCLELYAGHQNVVSAVSAHPFNRAFFTGDWSGSLYAWLPYDSDDFKGAYDKNLFTSHFYAAPGTFTKGTREVDRGINSIVISQDGETLALGTENGFIETWNVRGFERESRLESHRGRVLSVALSPDGTHLTTLGKDGFLNVYEIAADPEFGISATALKKRLLPISVYEVPDATSIQYVSARSIVAGTSSGKLVEADATGAAVTPTPTPTPDPADTRPLDTDY